MKWRRNSNYVHIHVTSYQKKRKYGYVGVSDSCYETKQIVYFIIIIDLLPSTF